MAMIDLTDIAMLFVRCKDGISHNPAEAITLEDIDVSTRVLLRFIENFKPKHFTAISSDAGTLLFTTPI